jgi:hypothetical protein
MNFIFGIKTKFSQPHSVIKIAYIIFLGGYLTCNLVPLQDLWGVTFFSNITGSPILRIRLCDESL